MGRSRLPERIKEIRGTDQPCRKSDTDLGHISKLPPAPKHFSKTCKKIYKTLGESIIAARVLSATNLPQFVAYCQEIGIYMEANESFGTLKSRVEMMQNENGSRTFVSGMQRVAALALQNALKIGREFGFTPATVSRIAVSGKKDVDEFSKFMEE